MGLFGFGRSASKKDNTASEKTKVGIRTNGPCAKVYKYDKKKDLLGSGNFAEVFKGTLLTAGRTCGPDQSKVPECVALKVIDKSKVEDMNDIEREIEIMELIQHKNVIRLFEVFQEPKTVTLVMELVLGGELFDRIVEKGNYSEKDAAGCIFQVCEALSVLHKNGIVHRDLKPENILYADKKGDNMDVIKIADFGLARSLAAKGEMMKTACGTPGYVAPEILANKGYDKTAVDMWSVGVILYILLCGFPPFYEEDLPALFDSILKVRVIPRYLPTSPENIPRYPEISRLRSLPCRPPSLACSHLRARLLSPPRSPALTSALASSHLRARLLSPPRSPPLTSQARYDFPSPWWDEISPAAKDLVKALLCVRHPRPPPTPSSHAHARATQPATPLPARERAPRALCDCEAPQATAFPLTRPDVCARVRCQLDIDKRLSADQVMANAWVLKDAKTDALGDTQKALKSYMAKQRLRKVAMGVIAKNKMERALADLRKGMDKHKAEEEAAAKAAAAPVEVS